MAATRKAICLFVVSSLCSQFSNYIDLLIRFWFTGPDKHIDFVDVNDDDEDDDDDEEQLDLRICNSCWHRSFVRKGLCANRECGGLSLPARICYSAPP